MACQVKDNWSGFPGYTSAINESPSKSYQPPPEYYLHPRNSYDTRLITFISGIASTLLIMASFFYDIIQSLSQRSSGENYEPDDPVHTELAEELEEQDRVIEDIVRNSRKEPTIDEQATDDQWEVLFSGIQEDAKGAHANRTRRNYTGSVTNISRLYRGIYEDLARLNALRNSHAAIYLVNLVIQETSIRIRLG